MVLINHNALTTADAPQEEKIRSLFAGRGITVEIYPAAGDQLAATVRQCLRREPPTAVIAAGGDGTVSAVAGALIGASVPLGVLPLETLNHFAGDLGIPADLEQAAAIIAAGWTRTIDVGEVNGHYFVNNASIGFYPLAVRERETLQARLGKGPAMIIALLRLIWRLPRLHLHVRLPEKNLYRRTPLAFIGNNRYEMRRFIAPRRTTLDAGQLCLLIAPDTRRIQLFRLAAAALLDTLDPEHDLEALCVTSLRIDAHGHRLPIALDGEVFRLAPPLRFRSHAAALRVLAPKAGA